MNHDDIINSLQPLTSEQLARLKTAIHDLSPQQLIWLSGYFWGLSSSHSGHLNHDLLGSDVAKQTSPTRITILSASQTGNARRLAEQLYESLLTEKIAVQLVNTGDFKFKQIAEESIIILITSTQGEGDPPEEAIALHKFLHSKKVPSLDKTAFAVFSLGDSSYEFFCQAGKQFDQRFAALGAERLLTRIDADVDYQGIATEWCQQMISILKARLAQSNTVQVPINEIKPVTTRSIYSKENPFEAELLVKQKITARDSDKDIYHFEIDLSDSDLSYQPGDALGVWYENSPELIAELLSYCGLTGEQTVQINEQSLTLFDALLMHYELTQNTASIVKQYATITQNDALFALCEDKKILQDYARNTQIVDMLRYYPTVLEPQQLLSILRPLTPRLYSIASSQQEVGQEVHITVGLVNYYHEQHLRLGGATGYLIQRVLTEGKIKIFTECNANFRLPEDSNSPIIMIGPGTGIAPFRAFMQHRETIEATGKNWLFFGNPYFIKDFLYQVEWQNYLKSGLLTRLDLAWSRDQAEKVYVQDKLYENSAEIWQWLQEGAHIYVCGDANHMARDVEAMLITIIQQQGKMSSEEADEYLSELRLAKRYQRDVY